MDIREFSTLPNLRLAWKRITTGSNQQYKQYFRNLYRVYEISLDRNLEALRDRIRGGSWDPSQSERIYVPKSSGLQRPLTILPLEDQIVLQALSNHFASKLRQRRIPLQHSCVFSNILQKQGSDFFFVSWRESYERFKRSIGKNYQQGMTWIAEYDLAAFYETISHDLLLRIAFPRTKTSSGIEFMKECLKVWTSNQSSSSYQHGIPQGPIASDFLAECFLLPMDEHLASEISYVRYVDDFRLLGETQSEVRSAALKLERSCRERGLIPQSTKFRIREAKSISGATGSLPSIAATDGDNLPARKLSARRALSLLRSSLTGKPYRIGDKSRARFVLFRSEPDSKLLGLVLKLFERHPEHSDAFIYHLRKYPLRKPIRRTCLAILSSSPYEFVRGVIWSYLADSMRRKYQLKETDREHLVSQSVELMKNHRAPFVEKVGAARFLCALEDNGHGELSNFIKHQDSPLLQAIVGLDLPDGAFESQRVVESYLRRTGIEPALSIAPRLVELQLSPTDYNLAPADLSFPVHAVYEQIGLVPSNKRKAPDPVGEILYSRYNVSKMTPWKELLHDEYTLACGLIAQSDSAFDTDPSRWLAYQNSFNHVIFLKFQDELARRNHNGAVKTIDRNGKLISFGATLDSQNAFSKEFPIIAKAFRETNSRRNRLPIAHPYDSISISRNEGLKEDEQRKICNQLGDAYRSLSYFIS